MAGILDKMKDAGLALIGRQKANVSAPSARAEAYKGAHVHRLNKDWQPQLRSGDTAIDDSWPVLTPRVRDLCRNDAVVKRAKFALRTLAIGPGIATFAAAMLDLETSDDDFNFESDTWFERWAEDEADVEGKRSFAELQQDAWDEMVEEGNGFLLRCQDNDPSRSVPLCYQLIESEQLDRNRNQPRTTNQNKIANGVEVDRLNRPVQYWFYDAHPFDSFGTGTMSSPIPASRVIHCFVPFRPSMTSGISWLSPLVQGAHDLDWYLGNELTAAAIGALLTLIHKKKFPGAGALGVEDGTGDSQDEHGNSLVKMGRGVTAEIGPEDEISVAESKRPNKDAKPFIELLLRLQAMATGISYVRLTGDYKATSYTAGRAAHLDDEAFIAPLRKMFGRKVCKPVRRAHTAQIVGHGRLKAISAAQFNRQPFRWNALEIQPPGREQLNPEGETDAAAGRLRIGVSTLARECGLRGDNWRRTILQRKRENEFLKRHGVTLDFSKGGGEPGRQSQDVRDTDELAVGSQT